MQLCGSLSILGIALLWDWNENWPFQVWPVATAEFSKFAGILSAALSQHHLSGFEIAQLEFHHLQLALFIVMVPKAHLTSHSRMCGSRWVITPSWLSGSWRTFLYSSFMYSCLLFLISSASVHTVSVLYCAHLCMKCSSGSSSFPEVIYNLYNSIIFL